MTILPPAVRDTPTEPPERARDSTAPPADLGPMGIALRLLALEAQVGDIHAETLGISKAYHDMRNELVGIRDAVERLVYSTEILVRDAKQQRLDRAAFRKELDELQDSIR